MFKCLISSCTLCWILALCFVLTSFNFISAQSCILESLFDDIVVIRDESTVTLRIRVENARFNDLSEDFQGLCGVRLNFNHNNLSDLVMTLTSPIGNSVTIIGPADKNGTNPSPIVAIEHDIWFRPSLTPAIPDSDLPVDWTNNNINWGANPPYTGNYYPFNGDFATEFKQGPVNGIWELTIQDAFINDDGLLREFELDICSDEFDEFICSPCESRSGAFRSADLTICNGSSLDYVSEYQDMNFDTSNYSDQYLIYSGDVLISYDLPVDFSLLSSGVYSIYSINVDKNDADSIQSDLEGLLRPDMEQYIDSPGGAYCINRSEPVIVQINEPNDSLRLSTVILCDGAFEVFRGDTIRTSGTYTYASAMCDTIFFLPVIASELSLAPVLDSVYFDCNLNGVTLSVDASSNQGITYTWTDESGTILSQDALLFQTAIGPVFISVDDGICKKDSQIIVLNPADTMEVEINSSVTELNCRDEISLASISANFEIQSYTWLFSDTVVGTSESIILSRMGLYSLDVVGVNGCVKHDSIDISDSRSMPTAVLSLDTIDCQNPEAVFSIFSSDSLSYQWLDSDMTTVGNASSIVLRNGGEYTVQMTNNAFCASTIPFSVIVDTVAIRIGNIPTEVMLNCKLVEINLNPSFAGGELESVVWSNEFEPNLSSAPNLSIDQPAMYTLLATAENGCNDTMDVIIGIDTIAPDVMLSGGTLTCTDPLITVSAFSQSTDILYAWSGPFDSQLSDTSVRVSVPGVFTVGVLDTINECLTIDTIVVLSDLEGPNITIVGDSILNCFRPEILIYNAVEGLVNPRWITPDGNSIVGDSILIREEGDYIFTALAANGCSSSSPRRVTDDMDIEPLLLPDTVFLNCITPQVNLNPVIPSSVRQIEWVVNNDTITSATFQIYNAASIITNVYYFNGCTDQFSIIAIEDMVPPEINILNDTIDCNAPVVTISTFNTDERYAYLWMGAFDGRGDTSFVMVSSPEIITLRVEDRINGCFASESVTISEDIVPIEPVIIRSVVLACDIPIGRIDVSANEEIYVEWTDPDGTIFMSPQGIVERPGPYSIRVTGENGCEFFTDWEVTDIREPVSVSIDTSYRLTCDESEISLQPSLLDDNSIVNWIYSNNDTIRAAQQDITFGTQLESVYIVDEDQCDTLIPLQFDIDTTTLVANILTQDSTNCSGEDVSIFAMDPLGMYDVLWTRDGDIVSIEGLSNIVTITGNYKIQIRNTENGCLSSDSVLIRLSHMPIEGVGFELENEICLGDMNGSFVLQNIRGGNGEILASFNGQNIEIDQDVFELGPASYELNLVDEFGCVWDTLLNVNSGFDYRIDLGSDIFVNRGETALISPIYLGGLPILNEFDPLSPVNEVSFDSILITPLSGGNFTVSSTSEEGCQSSDVILINFHNNLDAITLYIPNVISPGGAGPNNSIVINLPEDVISVDFFKIFDRWGEEIVSFSNILSGDALPLWDGSFNGEPLSSGVYIYAYQITTVIDGAKKLVSGDITVLR